MSEEFFLTNPVATRFFVTDPFNAPRPYANKKHEGLDLRALQNGRRVAILAAQRGTVDRIRSVDPGNGYGKYVRIRHDWPNDETYVTWYGHLSIIEPGLRVGDFVQAGQKIGTAGTTGFSSGVHLHITLQHIGHGLKGYVVDDILDPTPFFKLDHPIPTFNEMRFVSDLNLPDGTLIRAGQTFTKMWLVRNSGTAVWGNGQELAFFGDDQMEGPNSIPLPSLAPGQTGTISLRLRAPNRAGRHRSTWKGRDADGNFFPFELFTEIRTFGSVRRYDDAAFVSDETIPDGIIMQPGQTFLKSWRVRNNGTTTWGDGYTLAYYSDNLLDAPRVHALPRVRPNDDVFIAITLTAPQTAGPQRSTWRLRNKAGRFFGDRLFTEIQVDEDITNERIDGATYVDDVTINDGTRVQPQQPLSKIWRLRNTGNTAWENGYRLRFVEDHQMGAPDAIPLPAAEPGETVNVGLTITAPIPPGLHRTTWRPENSDGELFGDFFYAEIEVVDLSEQDGARFVQDIAIPDGTVIQAQESFDKIWRLRNTGSTAWNPGYELAFKGDGQFGAPESLPLPPALPGQEVDVSIQMKAPAAPGLHRSTWQPRNLQGTFFGDLFFAEIRVPDAQPPTGRNGARLERHETIPNGTKLTTGEAFVKQWAIRNTGTTTWGDGYTLAFVGGEQMGGPQSVAIQSTEPQRVTRVTLELTAPGRTGAISSRWRLRDPQGNFFGSTYFVSIRTERPSNTVDLLAYMRGDGRLYEMKHIFQTGTGQQRVQTQVERNRFYHVKNQEWEELWADAEFIYRGTDTSPGEGNLYTLSENGNHGSPWIPRHASPNMPPFRRSPLVTSRKKHNCEINHNRSGIHVTWIKVDAVHDSFRLPDVEGRRGRGIVIQDVVVLAAYHNTFLGEPSDTPFERYYYAKKYGLVMWEGIDVDHRGVSFMVEEHAPGARPDNVRERVPCLQT